MKPKILLATLMVILLSSCYKEPAAEPWPWPWTIDYVGMGSEEMPGKLRPIAVLGLKNITDKTFDTFKGTMTLRIKNLNQEPRDIPMEIQVLRRMPDNDFPIGDSTDIPNKPGDTLHVAGISTVQLTKADFEPIPDHMQVFYKYEVTADGKTYTLETMKVITGYWNQWRDRMLKQ